MGHIDCSFTSEPTCFVSTRINLGSGKAAQKLIRPVVMVSVVYAGHDVNRAADVTEIGEIDCEFDTGCYRGSCCLIRRPRAPNHTGNIAVVISELDWTCINAGARRATASETSQNINITARALRNEI